MTPHGIICKCGQPKLETQFFCNSCDAKLPTHVIDALIRSKSKDDFRKAIRLAVDSLRLPRTRNHQRKKAGTHRMHWNFAR
jgi:hypothetical protein